MNLTKPSSWVKKLMELTVKTKDDKSNVGDTPDVQVAMLLGPIAESGHVGDFASLLETFPDVFEDMALRTANTPLHVAARMGHLGLVRAIMDRRPRLAEKLNRAGLSPIHLTVESGHVEIVRELLSRNPDLFYSEDGHRRAPLRCAASLGKDKVVGALLEFAGSNLGDDGMDLRTDRVETSLHLAVKNKHKTTLAVLIQRLDQPGNNNRNRKDRILYDTPDGEGKTVIQLASSPELYVRGSVGKGGWVDPGGRLHRFLQQLHNFMIYLSGAALLVAIYYRNNEMFMFGQWLIIVCVLTLPLRVSAKSQ